MPKERGSASPAAAAASPKTCVSPSFAATLPSVSPMLDGSAVGSRLPLWSAMTSDQLVAALRQQRAWRMIRSAVRAHVTRWKRQHAPPPERHRRKRRRRAAAPHDPQPEASAADTLVPDVPFLWPVVPQRSGWGRIRPPPLVLALASLLPAERLLLGRRLLEEVPPAMFQTELKHLLTALHRGETSLLSPALPQWRVPTLTLEWASLLLRSASSRAAPDANGNNGEDREDCSNSVAGELGILPCSSDDVVRWTRLVHDRRDAPDFGTVGLLALLQQLLLLRHCTNETELKVARFRHEQWLWNPRRFPWLANDDSAAPSQPIGPNCPMSPLSCLLKAYVHWLSLDTSFHQVALQKAMSILQRLLDPTLQPCLRTAKKGKAGIRQNLRVTSYRNTSAHHLRNDLMEVLLEYADPADVPEVFGAMMDDVEHEDMVMDEESSGNEDGDDNHGILDALEDGANRDGPRNEADAARDQDDSHQVLEFSSEDDSEHEELDQGRNLRDESDEDNDENGTSADDDAVEEQHMTSDEDDEDSEIVSPLSSPPSRLRDEQSTEDKLAMDHHSPLLEERRRMMVAGCMEVLSALYLPPVHEKGAETTSQSSRRMDYLSIASEQALLECLNKQIQPPEKPDTSKLILRRAPTQEEFFQRSLTRNPVFISDLKPVGADLAYEPTVGDLRQYIADDLHMSESAELIEILVAKKILGLGLKLRLVQQVLWRQHLMESSTFGSDSGNTFMSASGLSMLFSSGLVDERLSSNRIGQGGRMLDSNTPLSALPNMIVTYRLAGVDGEATEDTVSNLVDPEASADHISQEREKRLEETYKLTRLVTRGRGIHVLLQSVQYMLSNILRQIYREGVGKDASKSRDKLKTSVPCASLLLLRHCCQLQHNRRLLVQARAPTLLLTWLLDILRGMEEDSSQETSGLGNPTIDLLQELIELLTSDISESNGRPDQEKLGVTASFVVADVSKDALNMDLLMESVETISLSPGMRQIVGKLLPLLTYGQEVLSRTLAEHFDRNIIASSLGEYETSLERGGTSSSLALMETFVQSATCLPCTDVCNPLRSELINCGFIERMTRVIMKDFPESPPPWSSALWDGEQVWPSATLRKNQEDRWRNYFVRRGLRTAFSILIGLCKGHSPTQSALAETIDFVRTCHWIEATSDNAALDISTCGLGLLAETLLDEMLESNREAQSLVYRIRAKTRLRKRELAEEKRKLTLKQMSSSFDRTVGSNVTDEDKRESSLAGDARKSALRPLFDLSQERKLSESNALASANGNATDSKSSQALCKADKSKPAWLAEMENLEEDEGLRCVVCQEGRSLQPSELLGLYIHVKRVTISSDQGGLRQAIDGTDLLRSLPATTPESIVGDPLAEEWYLVGRTAAELIPASVVTSYASSSRRTLTYTTTVSAGNAIHISCHQAALQADRNHAKAPKSEWEGAALRNSRVATNSILPLVPSRISSASLRDIDSALKSHQGVINNILGAPSKSLLWNTLHDVRLLLLRMAYGETLSNDCGGGSLASNCMLLFYQMLMAVMLENGTESDESYQPKHARALPCGFLAALTMLNLKDVKKDTTSRARVIADAAPMAALACIIFHNSTNDHPAQATDPKRLWIIGRDYFLRGLLISAGRRHALGISSSGCQSVRGLKRARSNSFAEWDDTGCESDSGFSPARLELNSSAQRSKKLSRRSKSRIVDFQNVLRPMISMFAIFDQLSVDFAGGMVDVEVEEAASRLVTVIESCQKAKNVYELIEKSKVTFEADEIIALLQKGMLAA